MSGLGEGAASILGVRVLSDVNVNGRLHSFVNPFSLLKLVESNISDYDLGRISFYSDGVFLCAVSRFFFGVRISRLSFDYTSLAGTVFSEINRGSGSLAIVGADDDTVRKFSSHISSNYVDIRVSYVRSGYFGTADDLNGCVEDLLRLRPDMVLVGMGAVMQERFILALDDCGFGGIAYTCGGFLDQTVLSGRNYYPDIIDRFNLRWAYRVFKEPRRLFLRYFWWYPKFLAYFLIYGRGRP